MKIVLAEDAVLIRQGLAALLSGAGHQVVAQVGNANDLREVVSDLASNGAVDVVVTDVRMPPTNTNDGLRAALDLRQKIPGLPVVILSAYVAGPYVRQLLDCPEGGVGYLLKERVGRVEEFIGSLETVVNGGVVMDPEVVSHLVSGVSHHLSGLTPREYEVLELMAAGLSNRQIAGRLHFSAGAVSKHVANVFAKLGLDASQENRRVRAVLQWLQAQQNLPA